MSEVTYFILYILHHNKGRHQPFWSDPLNPIFCLSLIFLSGDAPFSPCAGATLACAGRGRMVCRKCSATLNSSGPSRRPHLLRAALHTQRAGPHGPSSLCPLPAFCLQKNVSRKQFNQRNEKMQKRRKQANKTK